jgi:hypothetical protein
LPERVLDLAIGSERTGWLFSIAEVATIDQGPQGGAVPHA